ncbi:MAG: class I SAM-dependent methyltransferase [Pseudomonadota bacterium]|nr:class I SAM-dependent methyltransferase [Pseudomonadota bacterium]
MKEDNKGLKFYDNLDLSASQNEEELLDVYKKWASVYDKDNDDLLGTVSQSNSVQIFHKYIVDKNQKIIDVGCGTGLVGLELQKLGYTNFDGIDISKDMIDIAIDRGYQELFLGNLNDSLPIESDSYDAVLCVGVFTHGHVGPGRLKELSRIVKSDGLVCFTVNEDVYESYGFDKAIQKLEVENVWKLLELRKQDYMKKKNVMGFYCVAKVN